MSKFEILTLPNFEDPRGSLTVLQSLLPFDVHRIFWITDADGQTRGGHRHNVTRQALFVLAGSVEVYMNDGKHEDRILLNTPSKCLLVEPEDWHTMSFGSGAVLLVMASHVYSAEDYIDEPY